MWRKLSGAEARIGRKREDMPWTETEFEEEFRQWILDFPEKQLPQIYKMLEQYGEVKKLVIFHTREEADLYSGDRNF